MVWERRFRLLSWVFFVVMWVPLAFVIYAAVTEEPEPPLFAIAAFVICMITFSLLQVGSFLVGAQEKRSIRQNGISAKATIRSVADTGTMINNQPLLRIDLEVQPPYDERFTATVEYVVPYSSLPQVQPGNTVHVFYLEGTNEVAIDGL